MFREQHVWEGHHTAVLVKEFSKFSKTKFHLAFKSGEKVETVSLS